MKADISCSPPTSEFWRAVWPRGPAAGRHVLLLPMLVLVTAWLVGCMVGPDYEEPEVETPDAWTEAAAADIYGPDEPLTTWWTSMGDTLLTSLIERAELANLDLAVAIARVKEARAKRGVNKGELWPQVDGVAAYDRSQLAADALRGIDEIAPRSLWTAGFDAFWELDLFGGRRRGLEAATAELGASVENYRDVLVTLYAEVATAYVEARTSQSRIAYALSNAEAQSQSVDLTRTRFETGLTSALDVNQAQSNLSNTEAQIPDLQITLTRSINRLAVLLGQPPGSLNAEMEAAAPIPAPPDSIAVGLPAELLRRRPDVRRAERDLAAQNARIGVATSELYPKFGLSGFFQLQAIDLNDFGTAGSTAWGFSPAMKWNLFSSGKIRNQIRVEEARTEQLLYTYEKTVLRGLEEVENSMVAFEREKMRYRYLSEAVAASERSVALVHTQYISGLTNFQNYLDTQRSLFDQQDQLASSEGLVIKALISLNKALGGGWPDQPIQPGPDDKDLPNGSVIELAQGEQDQENEDLDASADGMNPAQPSASDDDPNSSQGAGDADY